MGNDYLVTEGEIYSQGYGQISKLVMRDNGLPIGAKGLYAYICSFAGGGKTAWPGREIVCHDLKINKDTFTKYLGLLREKDYIRVVKNKQPNGKFAGNTYIITISPCPKKPDPVKPCPKISDTNINSINNINNNDISKKLSTRANEFKNYQRAVKNELSKYT